MSDSIHNLDELKKAEEGLSDEDRQNNIQRMIGSLSALVPKEIWAEALIVAYGKEELCQTDESES